MSSSKIQCNMIGYRKGFVEVTPGIHDGCINLETWETHPDVDISNMDVADQQFPDDGITGNTELEMSIEAAEKLIGALQAAICKVQASG